MIVVAGECLVDLLVDATGRTEARPGGGPFNVARGVARLGQRCAFMGAISSDRFGSLLRARLLGDGVSEQAVIATDAPTTLAVAEIAADGTATYRFYLEGTAAPLLNVADIAAVMPADVTALHVGTLGLALEPAGSAIEQAALDLGGSSLLMLDPNCRPSAIAEPDAYRGRIARLLERADVVKVSSEDLGFLVPGAAPPEAARELIRSGGARAVLLTDGPGSVGVFSNAYEFRSPVPEVQVVDTVGAGDAFGAGFLASWVGQGRGREELLDEEAVAESVAFACVVAARTCERAGATPPRLDELAG